jgi:hypothetical protein
MGVDRESDWRATGREAKIQGMETTLDLRPPVMGK